MSILTLYKNIKLLNIEGTGFLPIIVFHKTQEIGKQNPQRKKIGKRIYKSASLYIVFTATF